MQKVIQKKNTCKKIHAKKYMQRDVQKKERDQRRAYFIHLYLPQKKKQEKKNKQKMGLKNRMLRRRPKKSDKPYPTRSGQRR